MSHNTTSVFIYAGTMFSGDLVEKHLENFLTFMKLFKKVFLSIFDVICDMLMFCQMSLNCLTLLVYKPQHV